MDEKSDTALATKVYIAKIHLNNLIFLLDSFSKSLLTDISTTDPVNNIYKQTLIRINQLTGTILDAPFTSLYDHKTDEFGIDWEYGWKQLLHDQLGVLDKLGSNKMLNNFSFAKEDNQLIDSCIKLKDKIDLNNHLQNQAFSHLTLDTEPEAQRTKNMWIENNDFKVRLLDGNVKSISFGMKPAPGYFMVLEALFDHWRYKGSVVIKPKNIIENVKEKYKKEITINELKSHISNLKRRFTSHGLPSVINIHYDRTRSGYLINFISPSSSV